MMKLAIFLAFLLSGCGDSGGRRQRVVMEPGNPDRPIPPYSEIAGLVASNCGPCHNDSNQRSFNEQNFSTSSAETRIKDGSMPPSPRSLSEGVRAKFIEWFGG